MVKLRQPVLSLIVLAAFLLQPFGAFAQQPPAGQGIGVVTTLQGQATVGRQTLPQPAPLHFKDDVFFRDQITTSERSTIRLLLGGKGILTIREQSQVTLDESVAPDGTRQSVVGLLLGKIGAAIATGLMRPGEVIEIKTPNAVAAVRGTVLIAEYIPPQGSAKGGKPVLLASNAPGPLLAQAGEAGGTSNFYVVSGQVTITPQGQPPVTLGAMQAVSLTTTPAGVQIGAVQDVTPTQINDAAQGLQTGKPHTGEAEANATAQAQLQVAAALANAIVGTTVQTQLTTQGLGPEQQAPANNTVAPVVSQPEVPPTGSVTLAISAGASLATFSSGEGAVSLPNGPLLALDGVGQLGLSGAGTAVVTSPLIAETGSAISHAGTMVTLQNEAAIVGASSDTTTPLVKIEGTTLTNTGGPVFALSGSTALTFFGPLLSLANGATAELAGVIALGNTSQVALGPGSAVVIPEGTSLTLTAPGFSLTGSSQLNTFPDPDTLAGSDLVTLTGGTLTLGGALLALPSGTPAVGISGDVLHIASTVTGPPSGSLVAVDAGTLSVGGDLVEVTSESTLNLMGASLVTVGSTGTVVVSGDVLKVAEAGTVSNSETAGPVIVVGPGGTLTAGGAYVNSSGNLTLESPVLELAGGNAGTGSTALLQVTGGTLSDTADLVTVSSATTLGRPLLTVSGAEVAAANVLNVGAPLTTPSGQPVIAVTGSSLSAAGSLATLNANLTLGGSLLAQSAGNVTTGGDALAIGSHTLTSGPAPVFDLTGGTLSTAEGAHLMSLDGGTANLGGPLLSLASGPGESTPTVNIGGDVLHVASTVTGPPSGPLISVEAGGLAASGDLVNLGAGSALNLSGPVLIVNGGDVAVGNVLNVGAPLTTPSGQPVIHVTGGTLNTTGSLATLAANLTLGGPLLALSGGDITTGADALAVGSHTLVSGTAPVFDITGGALLTVSFEPAEGGIILHAYDLVDLGAGSTLNLGGPVLTVSGGEVAVGNVLNLGAPLTTPTGQPVIQVTGSSLTTFGSLASLGADLTLGGPLLAQSGGEVTTVADALAVGSHTLASGTAPVFDLTGGTLTTLNDSHLVSVTGGIVNLGGSLLRLSMAPDENTPTVEIAGDVLHVASTVTGPPSGPLVSVEAGSLTAAGDLVNLGADSTLNLSGPVLTVGGGEVAVGNVLNLGAPLTTPSGQPVIAVTGSSLSTTGSLAILGADLTLGGPLLAQSGGEVTTGADALAVGVATLNSGTAPVFDLTGGSLTTTNDSHLVSVSGGTLTLGGPLLNLEMGPAETTPTVDIAGDVLHMASTVTGLSTESLVDVSAGSLKATGDLVNLGAESSLNLSGPVLTVSGGSATLGGSVLNATTSTLTPSPSTPLLTLGNGASLTVGHLLDLTNSPLNLGGQPLVSLSGGSTLTNTAGPLIKVTGGSLTADALAKSDGAGNTFNLTGSFLDLTNTSVTLRVLGDVPAQGTDTLIHTLAAGEPAIRMTDSNLTLTEPGAPLVSFLGDPAGVALIATNTSGTPKTISVAGPLLELEGVTLTDPNPQIQLSNMTANQTGGDLVRASGPVTMHGPLLSAINSNVTTTGGLLSVKGQLTGLGTSPFIQLDGTTVSTSPGGLASLTTYSENPPGTVPVDGLTFKGVTYGFTVGGSSSTDATFGGGGPGNTQFVQDPSLEGNASGVLTLNFANKQTHIQFGLARSTTSSLMPGASVLLKSDGSTLGTFDLNTSFLGTFSEGLFVYAGAPASSAVITFPSSEEANRFALDNLVLLGGGLISVEGPGASLSVAGTLLQANNLTLISSAPLLSLMGGASLTAGGPFLDLTDTTLNLSTVVLLTGGSTLANTTGPVFRVTGGSFTADSLAVTDGSGNTLNLTGSVLDLTNTMVTLRTLGEVSLEAGDTVHFTLGLNEPIIRLSNSTLTLNELDESLAGLGELTGGATPGVGLIATDNSTINVKGGVLDVVGGFNGTATEALLQLNNTTVNQTETTNALVDFDSKGVANTMTGPLAKISNSTINASGPVFRFRDGSLTSNTTEPFIAVDPSNITSAGSFISLTDEFNPFNLILNGSLVSDVGGQYELGGSFLRVRNGSTLTTNTDVPLLQFTNSTVNMNGNLFNLGSGPEQPGSTANLAGPLLTASNSAFDSGPPPDLIVAPSSFISVNDGATFASATTEPLLLASGGSITTKSHVVRIGLGNQYNPPGSSQLVPTGSQAPVNVTLHGPLLSATDTEIIATSSVLTIRDNATFTSMVTAPLIHLMGTTPCSGETACTSKLTLGGPEGDPDSPNFGHQVNSQVFAVQPVLTTPFLASAELWGPVLSATDTTISTADRILRVRSEAGAPATLTSHTLEPLVDLTGGSVTMAGTFFPPTITPGGTITTTSGSFLAMSSPDPAAPATIALAGPLLHSTGTTFEGHNHFLDIGNNAEVTSEGTDALVELINTNVSVHGQQTFTPTGEGSPSVTTFGDFARVQGANAKLNLEGPFVVDSGSTFNLAGNFLRIRDGATLDATTTLPLMQFTDSTVNMNGNLFQVRSNPGFSGSSVTVAGPVLEATNTTFDTGPSGANFFNVRDGATLTSTTPDSLFQLNESTITAGEVLRIARVHEGGGSEASVTATVAGPMLSATDSTIVAVWDVLSIGDRTTFRSTGTAPLIQLGGTVGTTVTLGGIDPDPTSPTFGQPTFPGVFNVGHRLGTLPNAPTSVEIAGSVLSAANSDISTSGRVVGVFGQTGASTTVSSATADPLVQLNGGSVTMAGTFLPTPVPGGTITTTSGSFLQMSSPNPAAPATLMLQGPDAETPAGPLLSATGTTILAQNHFLNIGSNSQLTSTGTAPLVQLMDSPLKVEGTVTFTPSEGSPTTSKFGNFLNVCCGNASVSLAGPLLLADPSPLTVAGNLVSIFGGAKLESTTTDPLIKLTGGTHEIGSGTPVGVGSLLDLRGITTDPVTGLGTDEVLKTGGAFLEADPTTITLGGNGNAIRIDTALLAASAPIIKLINSTLNTSDTGDSTTGAMHLYQSSVTSFGPVFGLDNSTLTIKSGPALSLTGGSNLTVNGDFASLVNGSKITVVSGPLIYVAGSSPTGTPSTLNVSGGLVNFGGTGGNQVIVNNSIAPTTTLSGLPVNVGGGGSSISIGSNPIKNPGLGSVTINGTPAGSGPFTGSLIQATGGGKVNITAP